MAIMLSPLLLKNAIISVFDKTGLEPLCKQLNQMGVKLYSTGGTANFLTEKGFNVTPIESVTQFPEMMDGRVKTLHPKVFGGILARRSFGEDIEAAKTHQIPLFDLVIVNLYPFWEHINDNREIQTKFVDIGGPSMLRAAAKNSESVTVLSSPDDYPDFLAHLELHRGTTLDFRERMAGRTFRRTSEYDALIASLWEKESCEIPKSLSFGKLTPLRYGENPHQKAAWGSHQQPWKVLQGKELSYNNLLDAESAVRLNQEFEAPAITIVKHNNPCGVATGNSPLQILFEKALQSDSKSAFGGIVASNRAIDEATARSMSQLFLEVIVAPSFSQKAKEIFQQKKNLRLIEWATPNFNSIEIRSSLGGWLIQTTDKDSIPAHLKVVTQTNKISDSTRSDLLFAWLVSKHVRSNAIVIAKEGQTQGIGAGQMSRVDAVEIALEKAKGKTQGSVLASDAFFPFRDNIDLLKNSGIEAIIQPGGSQRDAEVIEACNELGIAMVFTGTRHFRH
ncbi:MAG: bifunctional phosphoribosylaminoimidazolecarboxamide formyltransferase/IMP cyclohydrolase [Deltaproteobacteria bacterium]|nr:bifunctional phosphoribosylaminoimidazolecarboxamide formyltransferase/IMP cyclohydrolase [Deltaproteobacteria bacterium]